MAAPASGWVRWLSGWADVLAGSQGPDIEMLARSSPEGFTHRSDFCTPPESLAGVTDFAYDWRYAMIVPAVPVDEAFAMACLAPDIVRSALDADVIKA